MHFLIAPDSFKESMTAPEVANTIRKGFEVFFPEAKYTLLPLGDGGEGTTEILLHNMMLERKKMEVRGPYGDNKQIIVYGANDVTAVVEMAEIVGLHKISRKERNPLKVNTRGLGEFIISILNQKIKTLIIGVGGSASNDGGIGMAAGLGYKFLDIDGNEVEPIGENLEKIVDISDDNVPKELFDMKIMIMSDVTNPLCGSNGATYVYGPQKGLPNKLIKATDDMLKDFYLKFRPDLIDIPGSGAGGGMAAGLIGFANGKIVSGIDFVLQLLDFDSKVKTADYVIVGEGKMDGQSIKGKAPFGVAQKTPNSIPVIAICGSVGQDIDVVYDKGIDAVFPSISSPSNLSDALYYGRDNLFRTSRNVASVIRMARGSEK